MQGIVIVLIQIDTGWSGRRLIEAVRGLKIAIAIIDTRRSADIERDGPELFGKPVTELQVCIGDREAGVAAGRMRILRIDLPVLVEQGRIG